MENEWKSYSLGEICSYSKERINIQDVTNKNYISTENMFPDKGGITEATTLPNVKSVSRYEKGDTLISNIRPYFKKIWFSNKIGGASNDVLVIKGKSEKVFNKYLYYFLTQDKFFDYVMGTSKGTKMPRGDKDAILKYDIKLPPLDEQKAIAKVLSDLDEKIEINNKINKKLEEMAQAIFKQWFVDFEFLNEDGKPYKSSGGEMVESELGMIPKGWNIKKLSELADMKNGVNYGRNQEGEKVKVVNVRDFDGSLVVNDKKLDSVFLLQKQINDYRLQKYDTVIVRSAKPGETLLVNDDNLKVYSGFTIRIRPKDYNIKLYVFYCIRNSIRQLENSSNGTIFKNLNQQLLGKVNVIEPTIEIINKYNNFIKTIINKIYIVNEEINRLTDLRDTLLPKLMSGEIRVPID